MLMTSMMSRRLQAMEVEKRLILRPGRVVAERNHRHRTTLEYPDRYSRNYNRRHLPHPLRNCLSVMSSSNVGYHHLLIEIWLVYVVNPMAAYRVDEYRLVIGYV